MAKDDELKKYLTAAKSKPHNFALVVASQVGLIVDKAKIGGAVVKEKQKECGGGTVARGVCRFEMVDDKPTMIFETPAKVASSVEAKVKKLIKDDAGLMMEVQIRQKDVVEEIAEETKAPPPAPEKPPAPPVGEQAPAAAELVKQVVSKVKVLSPLMLQAGESAPDRKKELANLVAAANTAAKAGNKELVTQTLAKLELDIKTMLKAALQNQASDILKTRLPKMMPSILEAQKASAASAATLTKLLEQANAAAKASNVRALLDTLDEIQGEVTAAQKGGAEGEANLQAEWERRVIAIEPRVLEAQKTRPAEAKWMPMFMSVQDLGSAGDYKKALAVLDRLEGLLNAAPKAAAPGLAAWQTLHQDTVTKLRTLAGRLAKSTHARAKEAEIEVQAVIRQLTPNPATAQQVATLETYLKQDSVVSDVCELAFDFRDSMLSALAELKPQLSA